MDIKSILNNPEAAILTRWGAIEHCHQHAAILEKVNAISDSTKLIKSLKKAKNHCASQFKNNKSDSGIINKLKLEMKHLSAQLKEAETTRKNLNALLLSYFDTNDTDSTPRGPQQFFLNPSENQSPEPGLSIISAGNELQPAWDEYVSSHPNSSLYHFYGWRTLIQESFRHDSFYFAAIDANNVIVGILPLIRLKSILFGDFAVSMPFFNYGGPLAEHSAIEKTLLDHAAQHCQTQAIEHMEIRTTKSFHTWPARTDKVSMIKKLPESTEQLDRDLGSKIRAQIKRAKSEDVHSVIGGIDLLDDFYKVFAINMRDLGTPVYGKRFFQNILEQWQDNATIVIIYLNGKPAAGAFLLGHKDMLEIPWASALRKTNPMSINMLLYSEVLSHAIKEGYEFFDFGRSTIDSNTYNFKKQWGANPVQHHWHYWLNKNSSLPELNPDNPKFTLLINIWQRLPVSITRLIGPHIVKNLP